MADATPKRLLQQLIFGGDTTSKDSIEEEFEKRDETARRAKDRPSAYVLVFEGMIRTVLETEHDLLSQQEITALEHFSKLCYNARYCLARLVLRKPNTWIPVSTLANFTKEIGDDGLLPALSDLCKPMDVLLKAEVCDASVKSETTEVEREEGPEIIDLTMDADDEDVKPDTCVIANQLVNSHTSTVATTPNNNPLQAIIDSNPAVMNLDYFCEDETVMSLEEILFKLTNPQLQELVKHMKCKPKTNNKSDMIYALRLNASTQTILNFASTPKGKGKLRDDGMRQTQLPFLSTKKSSKCLKSTNCDQQKTLKDMALKLLGKCVRVNFDFFRLVRRLHIIYYRETEHPTALLLPSLLTTFKKWNYTPYNSARSQGIWDTRYEYLEYEKALEIEYLLLEVLEPPPEKPGRKATKTPAPRSNKFATPITPRKGRPSNTPIKTPLTTPRNIKPHLDIPTSVKPEFDDGPFGDEQEAADEIVPVVRKEEKVKECLEKYLFPVWRDHLIARAAKEFEELSHRSPGLQRFETGYVYTRMVSKATKALGPLKEYEVELQMIEQLLSQRYWSRGKRGKFYERRAIILGHLMGRADSLAEKRALQFKLADGLKEALLDEDTGIVWRPNLMKRLIAIEKRLKTPPEERSQCAGELREANIVDLKAVRVYDGLVLDNLGRLVSEKENSLEVGIRAYAMSSKNATSIKQPEEQPLPSKRKMGQKSTWQGRDEKVVDVETRALEFYEDQGYKGFHSETRILTTLFGLLFWDVIFTDIPGAFETAFQSAPLDILDDSFYYARKGLIEDRLSEIRAGKANEILQRHDDLYRAKKTMCLGVGWDFCTKEDLVEIVDCMAPESLAIICILFCQDYRGRRSGGPDLFVWNPAKRTCKFVEVKGPGDVARENQKLWFDALLRAGFNVDLCKVIDVNAKPTPSSTRKRKAKTPVSTSRQRITGALDNQSQSEEEDYDLLDPESEDEPLEAVLQESIPSQLKRRRTSNVADTSGNTD